MAAFTGTLSLADTIFEISMDSLLEQMSIDGAVKTALLKGEGTLAEYIEIAKSAEAGEAVEYVQAVKRLGLDLSKVRDSVLLSYNDSME